MDSRNGFTLLEVVIVLAVIAIIGAVIIPNFTGVTDRARLRSDIQSARTAQNAIDLYKAETGKDIWKDSGSNEDDILDYLLKKEYLNGSLVLQTDSALWDYNTNTNQMRINISGCADSVKKITLSETEMQYISSASGVSGR